MTIFFAKRLFIFVITLLVSSLIIFILLEILPGDPASIILGVGAVGHCSDVYTLKLRDFDAPMSGALYLTHRNPDLCQIYKEGEEIECYSSPKEALSKIKFYLERPDRMENVAKNGYKITLEKHTWEKRLMETVTNLGLVLPLNEKEDVKGERDANN